MAAEAAGATFVAYGVMHTLLMRCAIADLPVTPSRRLSFGACVHAIEAIARALDCSPSDELRVETIRALRSVYLAVARNTVDEIVGGKDDTLAPLAATALSAWGRPVSGADVLTAIEQVRRDREVRTSTGRVVPRLKPTQDARADLVLAKLLGVSAETIDNHCRKFRAAGTPERFMAAIDAARDAGGPAEPPPVNTGEDTRARDEIHEQLLAMIHEQRGEFLSRVAEPRAAYTGPPPDPSRTLRPCPTETISPASPTRSNASPQPSKAPAAKRARSAKGRSK